MSPRESLSGDMPSGPWLLPSELEMLRDQVQRFMEQEVRPLEATLPPDAAGLPRELLEPLQRKARAAGLWALSTPTRFGGAGLSVLGQVVVAEEAAKCRMGAFSPACGAFGGNPPAVLFHATPEQFERWGRPIVEGRVPRSFTAISEASGGSDPVRAIRCRAERRGDHYVLNGSKMWTSHAGTAKYGIVYARTGEVGDRRGISCFVVETDTPGLTLTPIDVLTSNPPYELHFVDAKVPVENRIGEEGQGFELAGRFLVNARITYAAGCIGIAQMALEMAMDWANQRETFGAKLADRQAIQWMIADSEIELRAARLLTYHAASLADAGRDVRTEAAVAKAYGTEIAFKVVDRCMQIFGGLGMARSLPLERWFRELRVKRIGEGATEVLKMFIARSLLAQRGTSS